MLVPNGALAAGPGAGVARRHAGGITLFKSIGKVSLGDDPGAG